MKTLQNDLTKQEQSEILINLGVPKNSANHYYGKDGKIHYIDGTIPYSLSWENGCIPCWSVGRLIEIMFACTTKCNELTLTIDHFNVEYILKILEVAVKYDLDFSKLEE